MNPKELYEKQFGEKKLIPAPLTLLFLRRLFFKYDLSREDIAIDLLKKEKNGELLKLLDVGCGSGSLIFRLVNQFSELHGIDISPSQIKEAQGIANQISSDNKLYFSFSDIDSGINFPNKEFDVVVCLAVLEHIFDVYFVTNEIYRILKPGGIIVLEVPNIAYLKYRIQLFFGKLPVTSTPFNWKEVGWDGGHLHYFTQKTLCRLLRESGFKILKISGSGLFAKFRNFWPSLLTGDLVVKAQRPE